MTERKTKGRFTIQFNLADPQQAFAAETLEQQGRHKAQFLTSAIREYLNPEERHGRIVPADSELEERVRELVERYMAEEQTQNREVLPAKEPTTGAEEEIDYTAVKDTLFAFDAAGGILSIRDTKSNYVLLDCRTELAPNAKMNGEK